MAAVYENTRPLPNIQDSRHTIYIEYLTYRPIRARKIGNASHREQLCSTDGFWNNVQKLSVKN